MDERWGEAEELYSHRAVTHEEVMGELTLLSKERFVCVFLGLIRSRPLQRRYGLKLMVSLSLLSGSILYKVHTGLLDFLCPCGVLNCNWYGILSISLSIWSSLVCLNRFSAAWNSEINYCISSVTGQWCVTVTDNALRSEPRFLGTKIRSVLIFSLFLCSWIKSDIMMSAAQVVTSLCSQAHIDYVSTALSCLCGLS